MPTIWFLDTSSLISIRSEFSRVNVRKVLAGLTALLDEGRLFFPKELVDELKRYGGEDNPALDWARDNEAKVMRRQPSLQTVKEVLADVPEVLDATKDSSIEEADSYVLAMAVESLRQGEDARVVSEEFKTTTNKMPLGSAAGALRIPSVSLRTMLKREKILDFEKR